MPIPPAANMAIVDKPLLAADSESTSASTTPVSDTTASEQTKVVYSTRQRIERHEWKILRIQTLHDLTLLGIPFPVSKIQTLILCGSYDIKRRTENYPAYHQNKNKHFQAYRKHLQAYQLK